MADALIPPLYVALDVPTRDEAMAIVDALGVHGTHYKVGLQLFLAAGRPMVEWLVERDKQVFLDLKFHDIPNTVASAVTEAARLGVALTTVHTLGGHAMVQAAVEAAQLGSLATGRTTGVLGVTMLTSATTNTMEEIGLPDARMEVQVVRLADIAHRAGAHGVVCSALELAALRAAFPGLHALVPGIRLPEDAAADQARVATPAQAVRLGADYLVVGRPITRARDPLAALQRMQEDARRGLDVN